MSNKEKHTYVSIGMGLQSSLLAIMIASEDNRLSQYYDAKFIFADTMEEKDETYKYRDDVLIPFLNDHGKEVIQVDRGYSLYDHFWERKQVPLGWANPYCSSHFKRDLIHAYYREQHGRENKNGDKYLSGSFITINELIGITTDEATRAKTMKQQWLNRVYPYIELELSRDDLYSIYDEYGLPPAPSSACKGCPNLGLKHFQKLKQENPEYYQQMVKLEVRAKEYNPDDPPTLLHKGSLTDLIERQSSLEDWSNQQCDGGYCFT